MTDTPKTAEEIIAPLPDDARFRAYYFGFEPTGVGPIDAVLSAVAVAGKGAHHTESWADDETNSYYQNHPGLVAGKTAEDLIQQNANRAADAIRDLVAVARSEATHPSDDEVKRLATAWGESECRERVRDFPDVYPENTQATYWIREAQVRLETAFYQIGRAENADTGIEKPHEQ